MELTCPNCGHKFDPAKEPGREYHKIASTYPCPKCGAIVNNKAVTGE